MYIFKGSKENLSKTQIEIAKEIGITRSYLSKILNNKTKCSKIVAYAFTKSINPDKEIKDFFERV